MGGFRNRKLKESGFPSYLSSKRFNQWVRHREVPTGYEAFVVAEGAFYTQGELFLVKKEGV